MSTIVCPACQLPLPTDTGAVRFCPACGYNLVTGEERIGWLHEGIDLRMVARRQRLLLWFVLVVLVLQFAPALMTGLPPVGYVAMAVIILGVNIGIIIGIMQLLAAMRTHIVLRILCGVLMFAPCISLLVLLVVNNRSTVVLQRAGLKVGLLGVRDADLVRVLGANACRACGYNLIGNRSGVCPECGKPTGVGGAPPQGQPNEP